MHFWELKTSSPSMHLPPLVLPLLLFIIIRDAEPESEPEPEPPGAATFRPTGPEPEAEPLDLG